jgi:biopolymer transport protein ExbB/TolQ
MSNLDLVDMWHRLGWVGQGVAAALLLMSFWALGLAVNRIVVYARARRQSTLYVPVVAQSLREGRLEDAIFTSTSQEYRDSHLARIVLAGLREYQFQRAIEAPLRREELSKTVSSAIQRMAAATGVEMRAGVGTLATLGATAPFVGLVGTVIGIVRTFQAAAASGAVSLAGVSAGISEALVLTALGLVVGIPVVWFSNYLEGRLEHFKVEMDNSGSELMDYFGLGSGLVPVTAGGLSLSPHTYARRHDPPAPQPQAPIRDRELGSTKEAAEDEAAEEAQEPDRVSLGVSTPSVVSPGQEFTARFVAYIRNLEAEVRQKLAGLSPGNQSLLGVTRCRWARGTNVAVHVEGRYLTVEPRVSAFTWNGEFQIEDFDVTVAEEATTSTTLKIDVWIADSRVARLRADLTTTDAAVTAFASYASEDRVRVLDRVAAIKISAGLDVYIDCLSLHPGEEWKPRIRHEIVNRDVFLLFWSKQSEASEWVAWEWKTALAEKGRDAMDFHPLEGVDAAPPPVELRDLHFGDVLMMVRDAHVRRLPGST